MRMLAIMGPTGSGKTKLAIELVQQFPCDIISVDSAMVYRGMDIGTAKPTPEEQRIAPHRLIDIRDPSETYSAGQFRDDALREIKNILKNNRIPLLVGGTMLYFKALQQGLAELPTADSEIRQKISQEAAAISWQELHKKLTKIDPQSAERINPNDAQRIQRALEIYELTGHTMTELFAKNSGFPACVGNEGDRFLNIAIAPADRNILYERIEKRFKQMLKDGFIEEVETIRNHIIKGEPPLAPTIPISLRAVGYRQIWQYLAGELTKEEMQEKAIIASRQLAKRQLTWLRNWPNLQWFDSENKNLMSKIKNAIKFY